MKPPAIARLGTKHYHPRVSSQTFFLSNQHVQLPNHLDILYPKRHAGRAFPRLALRQFSRSSAKYNGPSPSHRRPPRLNTAPNEALAHFQRRLHVDISRDMESPSYGYEAIEALLGARGYRRRLCLRSIRVSEFSN